MPHGTPRRRPKQGRGRSLRRLSRAHGRGVVEPQIMEAQERDARRDNLTTSGVINSTKTELQILQ